MAVVIRLARMGRTHLPFYRIAVSDSRKPPTGRFLQQIGFYNPTKNPVEIKIDEPSAIKWMQNGAQPSETVRALFANQGIMEKFEKIRMGTGKIDSPTRARVAKPRKPKVHKKAREAAPKAA